MCYGSHIWRKCQGTCPEGGCGGLLRGISHVIKTDKDKEVKVCENVRYGMLRDFRAGNEWVRPLSI